MIPTEHEVLKAGEVNLENLSAEQKDFLCASLFVRIRDLYRTNQASKTKETEEKAT